MGHGTIDLIMIGDSTILQNLTSLIALYLFINNWLILNLVLTIYYKGEKT